MNVIARGVDTDKVLALRVAGMSIRKIAKELNCTVSEVNAALDQLVNTIDGSYRSWAMAVELERLNEIIHVFYVQMTKGDQGAATILLKAHEQLCLILGLQAPASATIALVEQQAMERDRPSSVDKITAVLMKVSPRPATATWRGRSRRLLPIGTSARSEIGSAIDSVIASEIGSEIARSGVAAARHPWGSTFRT
jgi:hypothetical protein